MPDAQSSLLLIVYAPALASGDGRPLAIVRGLEQALTGLRLDWRLAEGGQPILLPQRDAWLTEAAARGTFPLLCNGDESSPVTVFGLNKPANLCPGGLPQFEVHVELPLDMASNATAVPLLEKAAEGARAWWGHATPQRAAGEIAEQTSLPFRGQHLPPRGLPALKKSEDIRSPEIPQRLGWLNYWSAATARCIGFPVPEHDADLLSRAQRTEAGGWIAQLTDAPLALDSPAHVKALIRAYERFPEIGGRVPPT
jgi:hypothetical protein